MASLLDRLKAWLPRKRRPATQAVEAPTATGAVESMQRRDQPPISIAAWLGEDESVWVRRWRYPADPRRTDPAASAVAFGLCCTSPIWWSMTARQREVFLTLCKLQRECGLHSLLSNVIEEVLWLARLLWWDQAMTGIPDESSIGRA